MLVHMRQALTPEQRMKLNELRQQWDADHPAPQRGRRNNSPPPQRQ